MIDLLGEEWLTVAQAAERHDIRPSLIYGWVKRGTVRVFIGNAVMMVLVPDVAEAEYVWRMRRKGHRRHAEAAVVAHVGAGE